MISHSTREFRISLYPFYIFAACQNIVFALSKGEENYCETNDEYGCNVLECLTKNKFDSKVIDVPVGIAFDPCTQHILLLINGQEFMINQVIQGRLSYYDVQYVYVMLYVM